MIVFGCSDNNHYELIQDNQNIFEEWGLLFPHYQITHIFRISYKK